MPRSPLPIELELWFELSREIYQQEEAMMTMLCNHCASNYMGWLDSPAVYLGLAVLGLLAVRAVALLSIRR